jgi:hypothetical protein
MFPAMAVFAQEAIAHPIQHVGHPDGRSIGRIVRNGPRKIIPAQAAQLPASP